MPVASATNPYSARSRTSSRLIAARRRIASSVKPAFSRTRREAWWCANVVAYRRVSPNRGIAHGTNARNASVAIPRPQYSSPSQ